jgi:hypothetical protein
MDPHSIPALECIYLQGDSLGKHLTLPPIQNGLEQDALLPLLSAFDFECSISKVEENQEKLEMNGIHSVWSMLKILNCWAKTYIR